MNRICCLLVITLICSSTFGQISSGIIQYERRINLKKVQEFESLVDEKSKYQYSEFQLVFNDSVSVFQSPKTSSETVSSFANSYDIFCNTLSGETEIRLDVNGKTLLLSDSLSAPKWKISSQTRTIAGFNTIRAYYTKQDGSRIYAWYAPDIFSSSGPEGLVGLPGAILGLATEDGGIVYFAKNVEPNSVPLTSLQLDAKKAEILTMIELKSRVAEEKKSGISMLGYFLDGLNFWK